MTADMSTNMKLEQQVVSLELAQRLRELGVKQESAFYYCKTYYDPLPPTRKVDIKWIIRPNKETFGVEIFTDISYEEEEVSAFTVAELGEMLPIITASWKGALGKWTCEVPPQMEGHIEYADTEADARAKCLIYLLENGLIKL